MPEPEVWSRPLDPGVNLHKRRLARALDRAGVLGALLRAQARRPYVRCVNYHHVPVERAASFESQLRWFAEHFVPVGPKELDLLQQGRWPHRAPGILLSFDDGCRTHAEVVAPLLERHGFVGWFFVPSAFCDVPEAEQRRYARDHALSAYAEPGVDRLALRWDQVRDLAQRHVVGAHTRDHVRLSAALGAGGLRDQVIEGKLRLEKETARPVECFAWVGGEESAYSRPAFAAIVEAGYRFAFGTNNLPFRAGDDPLQIERTNLEAGYEPEVVRFQLSGLLDVAYAPKRRRLRQSVFVR